MSIIANIQLKMNCKKYYILESPYISEIISYRMKNIIKSSYIIHKIDIEVKK